jgi:phosphoglycerate kinase
MIPYKTKMKLLENLKPKDLLNKTIFIRVDFNVPLQQKSPGRFMVTDDERIRRFLDTSFKKIHKLTQGNCRIIIGSHLGRPQKHLDDKNWDGIFNLQFVCSHFETLLKKEYEDSYIVFPPESVDSQLMHSIEILKKNQLPLGGIKFLPNLRYLLKRETSYRVKFIRDLTNICDVFINCAFGTSHRETRSIITLPRLMTKKGKLSVAGLLLQEEISRLGEMAERILKHPEQTVFIAGGSKVSDKIGIIKRFAFSGISRILLGGKMVNAFLLAKELKKGTSKPLHKLQPEAGKGESIHEEILLAAEILEKAGENGVKIVFPEDYKTVSDFHSPKYSISETPDLNKELQLDIGPKTIKKYTEIIMDKNVKNVFWNGPLGAFDHITNKSYAEGSVKIAKCLFNKCIRNKDSQIVIGGGDTAAIVQKFNMSSIKKEFLRELDKVIPDNINHELFEIKFREQDLYTLVNYFLKNFFISTGGGASLEFLEAFLKNKGQKALSHYLPGTKVLID